MQNEDDLTFVRLQAISLARQQEWDPESKFSLTYFGNELAGETGEACNVMKKLEREALGLRGSRVSIHDLAEELSDIIITAVNIANKEGIYLGISIRDKFNATSDKYGLKTRL